ncbi:glycerate kinase type-2 family protein [Colwellia sp. RE-S-Sl-9]
MKTKKFLQNLFEIAVNESLPSVCMPKHLENIDASNGLCVIGAGKAAVDMANTMHEFFGEKCYGTVVTRHGYTNNSSIGRIKILTAGHPIPDEGSINAGKEILALAQSVPKDVPVVFLISGGGSALLSLPIEGVSFAEKMQLNKFLLGSGASIDEINCVRKQLSQIKGGKLAQAIKGEFYTLIISDVVGDDPATIASGPTVKDSTTGEQALSVLRKYHWEPIASVEKALLAEPAKESISDQSISPELIKNFTIMANARQSIDKAIASVDLSKWKIKVLNYDEVGDANKVAAEHAKIALEAQTLNEPTLFFSGGELTVTLDKESGDGGPNQQYMLALAKELKGAKGISALACDTDGVDGNKDVAGAFIDEATLERAQEKGLSLEYYLMKNDSFHFFEALNDLIITGPTHTNVNDFRVIMVEPRQ